MFIYAYLLFCNIASLASLIFALTVQDRERESKLSRIRKGDQGD
ncbi:MAG: hypothetical protein WBC92_13960 [Terracidiphilus sp.]